jgi:hypothetical protein
MGKKSKGLAISEFANSVNGNDNIARNLNLELSDSATKRDKKKKRKKDPEEGISGEEDNTQTPEKGGEKDGAEIPGSAVKKQKIDAKEIHIHSALLQDVKPLESLSFKEVAVWKEAMVKHELNGRPIGSWKIVIAEHIWKRIVVKFRHELKEAEIWDLGDEACEEWLDEMDHDEFLEKLSEKADGREDTSEDSLRLFTSFISKIDFKKAKEVYPSDGWGSLMTEMQKFVSDNSLSQEFLEDGASMRSVMKQILSKFKPIGDWGEQFANGLTREMDAVVQKGRGITWRWIMVALDEKLTELTDLASKFYNSGLGRVKGKGVVDSRNTDNNGSTSSGAVGSGAREGLVTDNREKCKGCGRIGHVQDGCRFSDHPDFNKSNAAWAMSEQGKKWREKQSLVLPVFQTLSGQDYTPPDKMTIPKQEAERTARYRKKM